MKIEAPTLIGFLLARIAEDERFIQRSGGDPHPADRARVLAECKAKRNMIGLLQADLQDSRNALRREWAAEILSQLAAIYTDHPDFPSAT